MADYGIEVYTSAKLQTYGKDYYNNQYQAKDRAEEFIRGAYNRHGYSVNFVDTTGYKPNPPTEKKGESFTTQCPCDYKFDCSYSSVLSWFISWLDCNGPQAIDSTILLTKTNQTNGGVALGSVAHAQTGKHVCNLPSSYEDYGWNDEDNAMNTVLHEIGHCLMSGTRNDDGDSEEEHDVAALENRFDWYTITAMDIEGNVNDCGETSSTGYDGWEHTWSDCCVSNWS